MLSFPFTKFLVPQATGNLNTNNMLGASSGFGYKRWLRPCWRSGTTISGGRMGQEQEQDLLQVLPRVAHPNLPPFPGWKLLWRTSAWAEDPGTSIQSRSTGNDCTGALHMAAPFCKSSLLIIVSWPWAENLVTGEKKALRIPLLGPQNFCLLYFFFLRQGLVMLPRLALNLLCMLGWFPDSTSWINAITGVHHHTQISSSFFSLFTYLPSSVWEHFS
jgi:hypothetical protein